MTRKKVESYLFGLWGKSLDPKQFHFFEKIIFSFLCFLELFYRASFLFILFFKRKIIRARSFQFKILSVGNISVGGTGKSVFVQFLINNLNALSGAVVLRGYKGQNEKNKKSFLVADGKEMFCTTSFCGDEAFMVAGLLKVPVVVGRNRASSCSLLLKLSNQLDYVVLDDAYQNFHVKKDIDILLLDARRPFENGHCLPAGRLREKDYSRASAIILTHADCVDLNKLNTIKTAMLPTFDIEKVFMGRHKQTEILLLGKHKVALKNLKNKKFLVFAGIASFRYFIDSVKDMGVGIYSSKEYPDHHKYSIEDLRKIIEIIKNDCLGGAITTQKDWVKLLPLLKQFDNWYDLPFYVVGVEFEFLSKKEKDSFFKLIAKKME